TVVPAMAGTLKQGNVLAQKKIRVHELSKELGLTSKELLALAQKLGIGATSPSASIEDAQADRIRRRADADGLRREVQPEEPAKAAKATKATKSATAPVEAPPVVPSPEVEAVSTRSTRIPTPVVDEAPAAPAAVAGEAPAPAPAPVAEPLAPKVVRSSSIAPKPVPTRTTSPDGPTTIRPTQRPSAGDGAEGSAPSNRPPLSATGRPIPPPPGRPLSATGRPIPPPPGARRPMPGSTGRPTGGPGARPGGPRPTTGAPRPGGPSSRPGGAGGFSGSRPGAPAGAAAGPNRGGPPSRGTGGPRGSQRKATRRRRRNVEELEPTQMTTWQPSNAPVPSEEIIIERGSTAKDVGPKLNRSAADIMRFLFLQGEIITAVQGLSDDMIELYAAEVGASIRMVDPGEQQEAALLAKFFDEDDEDDVIAAIPRPPVVTVMGHVDHGKTMLLDKIRKTNVVAGEAGGITQHIGAYQVQWKGRSIAFIDTPGHEAFTAMRARGAKVTDIIILVVAADDGVMPQTIEAINHAKAANAPLIVAVNKIDKADANPDRVLQQISEHGLVPEKWGGDTICVEISALQGVGIDELLEQVLLVADLEELTARPTGRAMGTVLEANLEVGRGPVATVMVQKGLLSVGDPVVAGAAYGKVKALINDQGEQIKSAGPSTPVQILGFSEPPFAGDEMRVAHDLGHARSLAEARAQRARLIGHQPVASASGARLEDLFEQIQRGETATLNIVLKADVQGSLEACTESLRKLEREDVKLVIVHRGVGGITENDVQLAKASNATIIGFNVRPDKRSRELAENEAVQIRTYEIIYKLIEEIEAAMLGMLSPVFEEVVTGEAEVREIFRVPKIGAIAGCMVRDGVITRGSKVRFLREGAIIWKGSITSLRRFKDDAREVQSGFECGVGLSDYQDLKPGDIIETFEEREIPRTA
ncbi:MAG TPA: translation initiation factor IF-2, partial [Acidimicrobiales bacterium]|nr:translation initiation factor IF-2 [Acidimicrobiales bacterium]